MCKVSIIVPFYNAENFLDKCISSVLKQTYNNYELILVNDGSTDGSQKIYEKYCNIPDTKIRYIYQDNAGVSAARNNGINLAKGEFITFVDADDYLDENYLDIMVNTQNSYNADLTVCAHENYSNDGRKQVCRPFLSNTFCCGKEILEKIIPKIFYNDDLQLLTNPCCRLYKTEIIKNNGIFFNQSIAYNEDKLFNYIYSQYVTSFAFINNVLYYRLIHFNSAMRIFRKNIYDESLKAYLYFLDITKKYNVDISSKIKKVYFIELFIQDIIRTNICHVKNVNRYKHRWTEYYNFIKQDKIYDTWNNLKLSDFKNCNKWKIVYLFLKLHIPFMIDAMFKINNITKN